MQQTGSMPKIDDRPSSYLGLIASHPRILSFGVVLTLFSSFGQTFLIANFVPQMLDAFSLSTVEFGSLYAGATLTGALCLPFFGRLIDRVELRRYSLLVGVGLMAACFIVSFSQQVWMLFLGILGLRLTGQGLLSLTATTTMARVFTRSRGKALSVSGLGFPLGEGLLPLVLVFLIHALGWRVSWGVLGCFIGVVLLPLIVELSRGAPSPEGLAKAGELTPAPAGGPGAWTRAQVLKDPLFYCVLPGMLLLPFIATGLFLYQMPLAEFKGWSVTLMASGFIGFALGRFVFSLVAGPLIDRFGAVNLFPFYLLPLAGGLAILNWCSAPWAALAYLALTGVSQGLAGSIMSALWAEVYGTQSLGGIKSMISMFGICSTALSPIVLAILLQDGVAFTVILPSLIMLIALSSLLSLGASAQFRRRQ